MGWHQCPEDKNRHRCSNSSHLTTWRRQRERGTRHALAPKKRGPKPTANPWAEENRKLERRVEELLKGGSAQAAAGTVEQIGDIELHIADSDLDDRDQIGLVMDAFRSTHRRAISVLFTNGERPGIHVAVTDDLVAQGLKAGDIAAALAAVSGGKGGGRPHFASAGVGDVAKLGEARAQAAAIVKRLLAR